MVVEVTAVVEVVVVVDTSAVTTILRQKGVCKVRVVVVVDLVMVVVVVGGVILVSASAAATILQGKKADFCTGVLSLNEGVILLQLGEGGGPFSTVWGHFSTKNNDPGHSST